MSSVQIYSSYFDLKMDHWAGSRGYLLKFQEGEAEFYSVLSSWPGLGDRDLDLRFKDLQSKQITKDFLPVYQLGKQFGQRDEWAIEPNLVSHFLASGDSTRDLECFMTYSFPRMKVKLHNNLDLEILDLLHEADHYPPSFQICLDFNLKFSKSEVFRVFSKFSTKELERITWIEDAFSGSTNDWEEFEDAFGVRLYSDWYLPKGNSIRARVIKPIRDFCSVEIRKLDSVLVTSYLTHPMEQILSQKFANSLEMDNVNTGLCTHLEYTENEFSKLLKVKNASLCLEDGEAFQSLLDCQKWRPLGVFKSQEVLGS